MPRRPAEDLAGRRVLITGAARGIGAALATRLARRGAELALTGLEPELLEQVADTVGAAMWQRCEIAHADEVSASVDDAARALGGLDIVVANAGVAGQLPLVGGDPRIMERTIQVNLLGTYYTLRAAGPHIAHERGYALAISSAAAAVHLPLLGAYSASKAGVEALGNTLRSELRHTGARVGVAYFAELDTDMTSRGFSTRAAAALGAQGSLSGASPLEPAIDRVERGIARRSRRIVAPAWVGAVLPLRALVQPVMETYARRTLPEALRIAREENAGLTTDQPTSTSR
ncbi:SDR family NAD(P)-dependent oxidoreductase [Aeromicrobium phragmitis]|uniref:SDR family NAD(P)-dependent oxidoreductase n=1 Tax=Aeromicrobium phragmitis TaxID=2478914 RepID=A0A3L8PN45_9ACTN|nr:SDR family NAD(P)-dependent oxidoreductase [Aeromicrobium phragmitis]RLV56720.1 SDR family NAD(P)-dependent oxidoreductase [Aeromicrobium phragmitis]